MKYDSTSEKYPKLIFFTNKIKMTMYNGVIFMWSPSFTTRLN
jgi:hypothetical protein